MFVKTSLLAASPFIDAYVQSDFLGKMIFLALLALSVCTWIILLYKIRVTRHARQSALQFHEAFKNQKNAPLSLDCSRNGEESHPYLNLYLSLKEQTVDILNKNRKFSLAQKGAGGKESPAYLSPSDIDLVGAHLMTTIATQTKNLESNLYLLSTIVSLGPFLGLLGTVWGILTTFSQLQAHTAGGGTHQMVLGGLSLALATTVLGLIDAIPALVGYNYLKNVIMDFQVEMESFSNEILTSVELQYRQVDVVQ